MEKIELNITLVGSEIKILEDFTNKFNLCLGDNQRKITMDQAAKILIIFALDRNQPCNYYYMA
jgi:hypothetical protein